MVTDPALPVPRDFDDEQNNLVAAGAVLMALWLGQPKSLTSIVMVVDDNGNATNQIDVSFSFAALVYRLTIERVPD